MDNKPKVGSMKNIENELESQTNQPNITIAIKKLTKQLQALHSESTWEQSGFKAIS